MQGMDPAMLVMLVLDLPKHHARDIVSEDTHPVSSRSMFLRVLEQNRHLGMLTIISDLLLCHTIFRGLFRNHN